MAAPILKNLTFFIFKHASIKNVHFCATPVSLSLPLHFFSTQALHTNPAVYDILVHKHHFPCEFASWIASELTTVKNPETVDSMLSFLKSSGFSNAHLKKVITYRPRFLRYSLDCNIKPKINLFQDEGFSPDDIPKIISSCPAILQSSLKNNIIPSLSSLKGLLPPNAAVIRVVRRYPRILNMEKSVVANVEFLKSCGLTMHRIQIILTNSPTVLCHSSHVMWAAVEKTKEMGLTVASKAFIYGIEAMVSTNKDGWELKLKGFRDMGFSDNDLLSMFRKEPRVFIISLEKMRKITEGLVATGKFDISSIVEYPTSLMYSFENRYEPRIRTLTILESRKLIEDWPPLHVVCSTSVAKFSERFVLPYIDEVGDVYMEEMKEC